MITNSIQPYCYDIAHVLGLPFDFSHRFRYQAKWVKLSAPVELLKGTLGLLVFRKFDTADLIPIRFVVIENVLVVGDVIYIDFRVQNYFSSTTNSEVSSKIEQEIIDKGHQNQPSAQLDCLLFDTNIVFDPEDEILADDQHSRWSTLVTQIGGLECFRSFAFLRLLQVKDRKGKKASVECETTGEFSYQLRPDRVYFLEVIQQTPWEIDKHESIDTPFDVELRSEEDQISLLRKIQRVVGKYDLLRFIFKTPATLGPKTTFLELESKQEGESSKYRLPPLFIPVHIDIPVWLVAIKWVRRFVTVAAVFCIIASNPIGVWLQAPPEWIRDAALLIMVVSTGSWEQFAMGFVREAKGVRLS